MGGQGDLATFYFCETLSIEIAFVGQNCSRTPAWASAGKSGCSFGCPFWSICQSCFAVFLLIFYFLIFSWFSIFAWPYRVWCDRASNNNGHIFLKSWCSLSQSGAVCCSVSRSGAVLSKTQIPVRVSFFSFFFPSPFLFLFEAVLS